MTGTAGIVVVVTFLAIVLALYSGTTNQAGNAAGVFLIFLYLAFQGYVALLRTCCTLLLTQFRTFCATTMYICVSEIFPTDIRPIGMGTPSLTLGSKGVFDNVFD